MRRLLRSADMHVAHRITVQILDLLPAVAADFLAPPPPHPTPPPPPPPQHVSSRLLYSVNSWCTRCCRHIRALAGNAFPLSFWWQPAYSYAAIPLCAAHTPLRDAPAHCASLCFSGIWTP